jgi:hypothetical protein
VLRIEPSPYAVSDGRREVPLLQQALQKPHGLAEKFAQNRIALSRRTANA